MKKTILIVLFLLTFASTAFSKVQVPEDERWIYITGNKKQEDTWMDMYTMEFGRSLKSDYHHKEHKFARLWFMRNLYSDDTRFIAFYEFDLQCRTIRRLNVTSYDGKINEDEFDTTKPKDVFGRIIKSFCSDAQKRFK